VRKAKFSYPVWNSGLDWQATGDLFLYVATRAAENRLGRISGYGVFNGRIAYTFETPGIALALYGRNIFNNKYLVRRFPDLCRTPGIAALVSANPGPMAWKRSSASDSRIFAKGETGRSVSLSVFGTRRFRAPTGQWTGSGRSLSGQGKTSDSRRQ